MEPLAMPKKDEDLLWINKHEGNLKSQDHRGIVSSYLSKSRRPTFLRQETTLRPPAAQRSQAPQRQYLSDALRPKSEDRVLTTSTVKSLSRALCKRKYPTEPRDQLRIGLTGSPFSTSLTSQLDPFFILPCHLTHHDKGLLQYYLTSKQEPVYGHGDEDASCPIRPWTIISLQSDQIYLHWIVLVTAVSLLQGTPAAVDEPQIFSRKIHIYKMMSQAIADPETCCSDNTLSAVALAGVAETLLGDPAQGCQHLVAVRQLIERRGGSRVLQDMPFGQALPLIMSYIINGTGEATFPNRRRLQEAISSFIRNFKAMQGWNQNLRVVFEKARDDIANIQDVQHYRFSRRKVFGTTSILRKYLEPLKINADQSEQQFHFALLWILNKILYDLRTDHHNSVTFIEHFIRDVESAEGSGWERDLTAIDRTYLRPGALLVIVADCATKCGSETGERRGILHVWDAAEILDLMQLATIDSQEEVTVLLSSWLTNDECDIWYVGERRAREFEVEIVTEWVRRQRWKDS